MFHQRVSIVKFDLKLFKQESTMGQKLKRVELNLSDNLKFKIMLSAVRSVRYH